MKAKPNDSTATGAIRYACFQMMKEKPIENIRIREVTEKAGISRGTFYLYYESLHSLVDEVREEIFDNIAIQQRNFMYYNITKNDFIYPNPIMLSTFSYIKETVHEHQALWGPYGCKKFQEQARAYIKANVFNKLIFDDKIDNNVKYFERFITEGFVSLQTAWIKDGCRKSPSEIVLIATELCYKRFYS